MTNTQMEAFIINELNAETGLARIAAGTAGSDIKKALSFFEKDKSSITIPWFEKRKKILDLFVQMLGPGISENTVKALTLSRVLSLVPADAQDNLAILKTFIRDIMIFRFNPEKIVNLDFSGAFRILFRELHSRLFPGGLKTFLKQKDESAQTAH